MKCRENSTSRDEERNKNATTILKGREGRARIAKPIFGQKDREDHRNNGPRLVANPAKSCPSPETVFKEKHGVWDPMPELSITVNSIVSYPHPIQRKRGGVGNISPVG
jgi:hypothetical protein